MTDRVLDIWAVQDDPEEIYTALKNIKKDVVVFKNLICKFKIGNKLVQSCAFDNVIYSEKSDVLIMLQRGGKAVIEQAESYFNEHGINYDVVEFMPLETPESEKNEKVFWFARDEYVVHDAVEDSVNRGIKSCKYNPTVISKLFFKYPVLIPDLESPILNCRKLDNEVLLKISFRGLVEFEDKYILPTISVHQRNLHSKDISRILKKHKVDVEIDENINNYLIN